MPDYLQNSLAALEHFEGSISWMYRDTAGKVTTGVGLMLPDAAAAVKLPFALESRAATPEEIETEFIRVDALPMGRPALFYRATAKPELPKAEIDALLHTVVLGFEGALRGRLPGYDALPDHVKIALLDLIYNLGPAGLLHGFPKLVQAVETSNWTAAAAASERRSVGSARNAWTRAMLLGNVVSNMQAAAESGWKRFGFGLVGLCAAGVERLRRR